MKRKRVSAKRKDAPVKRSEAPTKPAGRPGRPLTAPEGLSILAVSIELGMSRDSIRRKLEAAGWKEQTELRWRDVVRALVGDKAAALARKALADAEMAEHEVRVATREVIPTQEAAEYVRRTFGPVREQAMAMPGKLAAQVNPTDPAHARTHLEAWVDGFLRHCRARTPEEQEEEAPAPKQEQEDDGGAEE